MYVNKKNRCDGLSVIYCMYRYSTVYGTFIEEFLYQLPTYQCQPYGNILLRGNKKKKKKNYQNGLLFTQG